MKEKTSENTTKIVRNDIKREKFTRHKTRLYRSRVKLPQICDSVKSTLFVTIVILRTYDSHSEELWSTSVGTWILWNLWLWGHEGSGWSSARSTNRYWNRWWDVRINPFTKLYMKWIVFSLFIVFCHQKLLENLRFFYKNCRYMCACDYVFFRHLLSIFECL